MGSSPLLSIALDCYIRQIDYPLGQPKVAKFQVAVLVHHDIWRLEIAKNNSDRVKIAQTFKQLICQLLDCIFRQFLILLNESIQISSRTVLKYYPKVIAGLIPIVKFQNIRMPLYPSSFRSMIALNLLKNSNLFHHFLPPIPLNWLDRHILYSLLHPSLVHNWTFSAPYFLVNVIIVHI